MNCGITRDRKEYHDLLYKFNKEWMEEATAATAGMDNNEEKDYKIIVIRRRRRKLRY